MTTRQSWPTRCTMWPASCAAGRISVSVKQGFLDAPERVAAYPYMKPVVTVTETAAIGFKTCFPY